MCQQRSRQCVVSPEKAADQRAAKLTVVGCAKLRQAGAGQDVNWQAFFGQRERALVKESAQRGDGEVRVASRGGGPRDARCGGKGRRYRRKVKNLQRCCGLTEREAEDLLNKGR